MRTLLVLLALAGAAVATGATRPSVAVAHETPTVEEFIEIVRGYDVATIRRTFPAYNTGLFERVFGAGTPIPLGNDHDRALFTTQIVESPAAVRLDIGHVVAGLEAAAPLPPSARQLEMLSGCQMRASVTWSGDVGEALVLYLLSDESDPAPFFDRSVPVEDLYGNIDGYVLGAESGGAAIDVADLLTRAYLESDYEWRRFGLFWAALGADPEGFITRQVICFARSYAALTGASVDAARLGESAPYFLERFIGFVREGIEREETFGAN